MLRTQDPAKDIIVTTVRLPRDVKAWLRERADHFGGSPNAELVRLCRLAMDANDKSGRTAAAASE
jgi:hypothetical protein